MAKLKGLNAEKVKFIKDLVESSDKDGKVNLDILWRLGWQRIYIDGLVYYLKKYGLLS